MAIWTRIGHQRVTFDWGQIVGIVTTTWYTQSRGIGVWVGGDVVVCFEGLVSPLFGDLA